MKLKVSLFLILPNLFPILPIALETPMLTGLVLCALFYLRWTGTNFHTNAPSSKPQGIDNLPQGILWGGIPLIHNQDSGVLRLVVGQIDAVYMLGLVG